MAIRHANTEQTQPPVIAAQAHYQRVVDDKLAIETIHDLRLAFSVAPHEYRRIDLYAPENVLQAMDNGTFAPVRCPNELYGIYSSGRVEGEDHFRLILDGVYNVARVAEEYASIPGVDEAKPGYAEGGGEGAQFIDGEIVGDAYYYEVSIREPFSDGPSMEYYYCSLPGQEPQEYAPAEDDPCSSGR